MPQNNVSKNGSATGVVTLIGQGARIEGTLTFRGYLRIQGDIVGDIRCDDDRAGTAVVHGAGSVIGSIAAPNLVIGGRVQGPMHAGDSIEILDGAQVRGDARYRLLTIEPGAIVEGELIPSAHADGAPDLERRVLSSDEKDIQALDGALAHGRRASDRRRAGARSAVGIGVAAGLAVAAGLWLSQDPGPLPVATADPAAAPAAPPALPAPTQPLSLAPAEAAPVAAAAMPAADPVKVEGPPPAGPAAGRIITVTGADPAKPAGVVYVRTREPAVLWVKPRAADAVGRRIEVPGHASKKYPISADEVLRVTGGRGVELFFQGRKLSPAALDGGHWIAFEAAEAPTAPASPVAAAMPSAPANHTGATPATGN